MEHLESNRRTGSPELARTGLNLQTGARRLRLPRVGIWVPLLIALVALGAWELGVRIDAIDGLHFPAPLTIIRTIWRLGAHGALLENIAVTVTRLGWGVLFGGGAGLLLGLLMGWSRAARIIIDPFVGAFHPLPKIAILPLVMVIFGVGDVSRVIVIAAGAFFPFLISTMSGVIQINPIHFAVARSYRAGRPKIFRRVVLPGAMPSILAGVRLGLNSALLLAIAVEMVSTGDGLGGMIWLSWTTLRTEEIYAVLVVTVAFGLAVNLVLAWATRILLPWKQELPT